MEPNEKKGEDVSRGTVDLGRSPVPSNAEEVLHRVTRGESCEEILLQTLKELLEKWQEIDAAAVVGLDGAAIASIIPPGYEEIRLGALSAAIHSLGQRTAAELGRGELAQVFIEGSNGYVFLLSAGREALISVFVRRGAQLGMVLNDIRNAAEKIARAVGSQIRSEYE